jgi:hypothetical protein
MRYCTQIKSTSYVKAHAIITTQNGEAQAVLQDIVEVTVILDGRRDLKTLLQQRLLHK